jgi:hypothetical protein
MKWQRIACYCPKMSLWKISKINLWKSPSIGLSLNSKLPASDFITTKSFNIDKEIVFDLSLFYGKDMTKMRKRGLGIYTSYQ